MSRELWNIFILRDTGSSSASLISSVCHHQFGRQGKTADRSFVIISLPRIPPGTARKFCLVQNWLQSVTKGRRKGKYLQQVSHAASEGSCSSVQAIPCSEWIHSLNSVFHDMELTVLTVTGAAREFLRGKLGNLSQKKRNHLCDAKFITHGSVVFIL